MGINYSAYQLPDELIELKNKYRRFNAEEIIPLETDSGLGYDADRLPEEDRERLVKKCKAEGLWGPNVPREYGGIDLNAFSWCVVAEEWVQHRAGLYAPGYGVYGITIIALPFVIFGGTKDQIEKYAVPSLEQCKMAFWGATEAGPGSDYASLETRAVKKGDHYIINGVKWFASGGLNSDWGLITALTDKGMSIFIIEKNMPGVTILPQPGIRRAVEPAQVILENVKVPKENLLGKENKGGEIARFFFQKGRAPYSAHNLGVSVAANRIALEYAKNRVVFGEPLSRKQAIQGMLVDSEIEIRAARWLIWEAAQAIDKGKDARMEVTIAKVFSSETLGRVIDRAVQILGGWGVDQKYPLERWYREARIRRIGEGPSEVHRFQTIAKLMLREENN